MARFSINLIKICLMISCSVSRQDRLPKVAAVGIADKKTLSSVLDLPWLCSGGQGWEARGHSLCWEWNHKSSDGLRLSGLTMAVYTGQRLP